MAQHEAALVEVGVFRDDDEPLFRGVGPDGLIISSVQTDLPDMGVPG